MGFFLDKGSFLKVSVLEMTVRVLQRALQFVLHEPWVLFTGLFSLILVSFIDL